MVLPDIQLQVRDATRVIFIECQRRRPEGMADLPEGPLRGVSNHGPHPQRQSLTRRPRRVSGVHGRRRAVQHSLRCVQSRVDDTDVQVREVTGPPSGRAQQGGLQTASAPVPARRHAHPSPGEAGPEQVPAGRADRLGRGAVEPDRYAGDRAQAPGYPAAGRLSGHGRMPQADAEKLTVIARARGHEGGVEVAGQRTPWLDAGEDETAILLTGFQPLPGGLSGEDARCLPTLLRRLRPE